MSYTDLYLQKQSRIPPVLIAVVFVVIAGLATFFVTTNTTPTRASKKTVKRHEVVNVAAYQAGIFWEAEVADKGWIIYGDNASKLNNIALDTRDISDQKKDHVFHFAQIKNLEPDTTYFYKIVSNDELIAAPSGEPFQFKTIINHTVTSSLKPAYGKVIQANGDAAAENIIFFQYQNNYPLVVITGSTGEWLIPLQFVVDKDTNQPGTIAEGGRVTIDIYSEDKRTEIQSLVKKLSPVPQTIILGKDYSFLDDDQVLPASTQREVTAVPTSGRTQSTVSTTPISILYPKEGSIIPGTQPLIRGVGVAGKYVNINLNSVPQFSVRVPVSSDGSWRVTLPNSVQPGSYQITMTTEDARGKQVGMKSKFTIAKSGEQVVLAESTPAGTLTPTKLPTLFLTATPTSTMSATLAATLIPTVPASAPPAQYNPPPPVSGTSFVPYIFTGIGLVIIGAGMILLF
jgi:hypothetical protein